MKNTVAIALFMLVSIFNQSCRKTNEPGPPTDTPYGGEFAIAKNSLSPLDTVENQSAMAFFVDMPDSLTGINVGTVSLNNKQIVFQGAANQTYNLARTNFHLNDSTVWRVSGGSGVAAFSYNDNTPFPKFLTPLPDTISKSGWNYTFSAVDADSIIFTIRYPEIEKRVGGSSTSVSFSAADMAGIQANTPLALYITVFSTHYAVINGKNYSFFKEDMKAVGLTVVP
ncbi:MAG: hypothetical protein JSS64_03780 [Bacteroidetes bacterium]|nr:hypothetical protein [Bacteroidota bacterium]